MTQPLPQELERVLRWYQEEAVEAALEKLQTHRSTCLVMATGLGKTECFSEVIRRTEGRRLVLVHRDELVHQAKQRLEQMTGQFVDIEQAELKASPRSAVVVASVQTLHRDKRLEKFPRDHFSLIVIDEFHHAPARTYRKILDYFTGKVLGVTATPNRTDEIALGTVCESVAYTMDILDGISEGYLVPIVGRNVRLQEINLSRVGISKGDLAQGQLDEAMVKAVEGIVAKTLELAPGKRGIAFFPGVKTAEYACNVFNRHEPGSAFYIDARTKKGDKEGERKDLLRRFRQGEFRWFCNVGIATEGFDAPDVDCIVQGRPTLSLPVYTQMIGRGTRTLPGLVDRYPRPDQSVDRQEVVAWSAKPSCLVLDFVGNSGRHELVTTADILGGRFTEAEVKLAKKKIASSLGADVLEELRRARLEIAELAKVTRAKVMAVVDSFDPFSRLGLTVDRKVGYVCPGQRPAPSWVIQVLTARGFKPEELRGLSMRGARKLKDETDARKKAGYCTVNQLRLLQGYGVTKRELPFETASKAIDYLVGCPGWGPKKQYDPVVLETIINNR